MIQAPTSIFYRQAIMVYFVHDDESDSGEDRRARHVRINERTDTIALTSGFEALNNSLGGNHPSHPPKSERSPWEQNSLVHTVFKL